MPDLNFALETSLLRAGYQQIAGLDEVGRGPLAGPVTVAAVILDPHHIPAGLDDSKKLSPARREALFEAILGSAQVSVVSLPAQRIDQINILQATFEAMRRAILALTVSADFALIDGRDVPSGLACPAKAIIKGDAKILSIAAASIIAKVTRDRVLQQADLSYPAYGFASNKGYGSPQHLAAIAKFGATPLHRLSFAPLRNLPSP